jgi:hypothetical protein
VSIYDKGYVVVCKSRAGCESFFKWFNENVLVPFVKDIRRNNNLPDNSTAWYQLDGEDVQIKCYKDQNMLNYLEENNIVIGKPSASTTAITQPCDAGNAFKASKTCNKYIHDADISSDKFKIDDLNQNLSHETTLDTRRKKLAVYGLLRVHLALQKCMRHSVIVESFKVTGIYISFQYLSNFE